MKRTLLLVLLAGTACSNSEGGDWAGSVRDSAGITIVENPADGVWANGDAWRLEEVLRIGTAEGEPEYQFGQLSVGPGQAPLAVTSDGRIAVLDGQAQHIKIFSPEGAYQRTIGTAGNGPGEIGPGANTLLVTAGDTLLLPDVANQRVNLYLLDGTFVRSIALNFQLGIPFRWETAPDGRPVAQMRRLQFPGSTTPPDSMDAIMAFSLDATPGDTLLRVPSGRTLNFAGGQPEITIFSPEPAWTLIDGRVVYAVSDQYRLGVYQPGGQVERVITKPFTAIPVTTADQDAFKDFMGRLATSQGAPPAAVQQFLQTVRFADDYPAFTQVRGGPDGTIWVQGVQTAQTVPEEMRERYNPQQDMGSPEWDVFDADGRYLGVVHMPPTFQPIVLRDDRIYGVERDDLDVQYVVVARIANYTTPPLDDR